MVCRKKDTTDKTGDVHAAMGLRCLDLCETPFGVAGSQKDLACCLKLLQNIFLKVLI